MDIAALRTLIESDSRYATALQNGDNGELVRLLNEVDAVTPSKRWVSVPAEDFMDAIADEALTVSQAAKLQLYLANRNKIPVQKAGVRAWILAQSFDPSTLTVLQDLAQVDAPYCAAVLGEDDLRVSVKNVREALKDSTLTFNSPTQVAARIAAKAARLAVEAARYAAISAAVDAEGPAGIRTIITQTFSDPTRRRNAEILLRMREDRIANP